MTRQKRRVLLHKACEFLEVDRDEYACHAIARAECGWAAALNSCLAKEFALFYEGSSMNVWQWELNEDWRLDYVARYHKRKAARILAILFFAEIGLEGIGEG